MSVCEVDRKRVQALRLAVSKTLRLLSASQRFSVQLTAHEKRWEEVNTILVQGGSDAANQAPTKLLQAGSAPLLSNA